MVLVFVNNFLLTRQWNFLGVKSGKENVEQDEEQEGSKEPESKAVGDEESNDVEAVKETDEGAKENTEEVKGTEIEEEQEKDDVKQVEDDSEEGRKDVEPREDDGVKEQ